MPADAQTHFYICEAQRMDQVKYSRFLSGRQGLRQAGIFLALAGALVLTAAPAYAHHAMGEGMPSGFFEGFISGIAHPLIGPDHLACIVAVGLLAAVKRQGILIPIAFVLAAMLGTGAHLAGINLPGVELLVSGSILLFGMLLVVKDTPGTGIVAGLSAVAGLFHGYAYGESIFGAEVTPLLAYLVGFTTIQLFVSLLAFQIGRAALLRQAVEQKSSAGLRYAGLVICGAGLAFFTSQVIAAILPAPIS